MRETRLALIFLAFFIWPLEKFFALAKWRLDEVAHITTLK
jgi:hypothetical protein